jgi:hypothetical protein
MFTNLFSSYSLGSYGGVGGATSTTFLFSNSGDFVEYMMLSSITVTLTSISLVTSDSLLFTCLLLCCVVAIVFCIAFPQGYIPCQWFLHLIVSVISRGYLYSNMFGSNVLLVFCVSLTLISLFLDHFPMPLCLALLLHSFNNFTLNLL